MLGKKLVGAIVNSAKQAAAKAPQSAVKPSSPVSSTINNVVNKAVNATAQALRPPAQPPGAPPKNPSAPAQFKSMAQVAPKIVSGISNAMRGMAGRPMKSGGKSKGGAKKSNW